MKKKESIFTNFEANEIDSNKLKSCRGGVADSGTTEYTVTKAYSFNGMILTREFTYGDWEDTDEC